jgi:hypothetical protein
MAAGGALMIAQDRSNENAQATAMSKAGVHACKRVLGSQLGCAAWKIKDSTTSTATIP